MFDDLMCKFWTADYTCWNFAKDVWFRICNEELTFENRVKIENPISPCICYMSNSDREASHVGIYYNGKVLHLTARCGHYAEISFLKTAFLNVSFFK